MILKKQIKTSTGLLVTLATGIILFGAFFAYFYLTESATDVDTTAAKKVEESNITAIEDNVLPDFSDIRKAVSLKDEKWIATNGIIKLKDNKVRLYTQKDGLPGSLATDLAVFNNEIWAGFQGGVAKYNADKDTFSPFLEGESNVSLFVDPIDNKLFASTFRNFFEWNGSSWEKQMGNSLPLDSRQIVFTKDYIASSSFPAHPVTVYNRSTKTWAKPEISEFGDQQGQTLFQANDRVFLYGRSKHYQGCDQNKKEASSIFFELKNGEWESVPTMNDKFANYEPVVQKVSAASEKRFFFYNTDPCSDKTENYKKVEIDFSNNDIKFLNEVEVKYADVNVLDFDLADVQKSLSTATGFSPFKEIKAIDSNGNLLAKTSGVALSGSTAGYSMVGFAVIRPTNDGYKEQAVLPNSNDNPSYMTPILCSRKSGKSFDYLLAQEINEMGGETTKAELYSISGDFVATKITPEDSAIFKSLPTTIACKDDTLFWQGNKTIKSLNLRNFSTSEVPINIDMDANSYEQSVLFSDSFVIYDPKAKKIAKYTLGAEKAEEITIATEVKSKLTDMSKLLNASQNHLWLITTTESSNAAKKVYAIGLDGKMVSSFEIVNEISSLSELDSEHIIGKKRLGVFTALAADPKVKLLDNNMLPFWGKGDAPDDDFSTFDRIGYNFLIDSKFNKVWFVNSGINFSIDINKLNK